MQESLRPLPRSVLVNTSLPYPTFWVPGRLSQWGAERMFLTLSDIF